MSSGFALDLAQERRVGGDAREDAPSGDRLDVGQVGRIDEELHAVPLPRSVHVGAPPSRLHRPGLLRYVVPALRDARDEGVGDVQGGPQEPHVVYPEDRGPTRPAPRPWPRSSRAGGRAAGAPSAPPAPSCWRWARRPAGRAPPPPRCAAAGRGPGAATCRAPRPGSTTIRSGGIPASPARQGLARPLHHRRRDVHVGEAPRAHLGVAEEVRQHHADPALGGHRRHLRLAQAGGVVEDRRARRDRRPRDRRLEGVHRHRHVQLGDRPR